MQPSDVHAEGPSTRWCTEHDVDAILDVINDAAEAYKGVIPADRWHEPYMRRDELQAEMTAGVRFTAFIERGSMAGVMGIQSVRNVRLIRHAYVLTGHQGRGIGSALLGELKGMDTLPILIGTWAAATWAIRFYERHGFTVVPDAAVAPLLRAYWNVPDRQIESSVVLAAPALSLGDATALIARA
jgi:GNAT superfamily N-acetyltransferase